MENDKKLTYYAICKLAAAGDFDLIPSGYDIIWYNNLKPEKVFNLEIGSKCITFPNNQFAQPDTVKISGEYVVVVPTPNYMDDDEDDEDDELVEFGEVLIKTKFELSNISFIFKEENKPSLLVSLDKYNDLLFGRGHIQKKDLVFDCSVNYNNEIGLTIYNMLLSDATEQEDGSFVVNFIYDYVLLNV